MAKRDCIKVIRDATRDGKGKKALLSEDEAKDLIARIKKRVDAKKGELNPDSIDAALKKEIEEEARQLKIAALMEQRRVALNTLKRNSLNEFIDRFKNSPYKAFRALLVGENTTVKGARHSIDNRITSMERYYAGNIMAELDQHGLMRVLQSDEYEQDLAEAMFRLNTPGAEIIPGPNLRSEAIKAAKILSKWQGVLVNKQNQEGAFITQMRGYIVRNSHDVGKLRHTKNGGFEGWRDFILPLLDNERTFKGVDPEDQSDFLRSVYFSLASGEHYKPNGGAESDAISGLGSAGSLAKKVSEHRLLHWKDGVSWSTYNKKYGMGTFRDAYFFGVRRAARNIALMERLGTNPEDMLFNPQHGLLAEYRKGLRETDLKQLDKLKDDGKSGPLRRYFNEVSGATDAPENLTIAAIGRGARLHSQLTSLGRVAISAVTDLAFKASAIRYRGGDMAGSYVGSLGALFEGFDGDYRRLGMQLGAGIDGIQGSMASRIGAEDGLPGTLSSLTNLFYNINLLTPWTDSQKRQMATMTSELLAHNSQHSFEQMTTPELGRFRKSLEDFDIKPEEWELLRGRTHDTGNGYTLMLAEAAQDITDDEVRKLIGQDSAPGKIQRFKDQLQWKLQGYIIDSVEDGVITPGARERAQIHMGTQAGTVAGEIIRTTMQFKSFALAAVNKSLGREFHAGGRPDVMGLAGLIAGTWALGYVAMAAKDLVSLKKPRDPTDPRTLIQAFAQGGGAGIYADFLFGNFSRTGRTLQEQLMGPTFSRVGDMANLWSAALRGEDIAATAFNKIVNLMPFSNLMGLRTVLDYSILYRIQESLNPGYLQRMEDRIMKETGQEYILPPTSVLR